jgi:hypothetical protein
MQKNPLEEIYKAYRKVKYSAVKKTLLTLITHPSPITLSVTSASRILEGGRCRGCV